MPILNAYSYLSSIRIDKIFLISLFQISAHKNTGHSQPVFLKLRHYYEFIQFEFHIVSYTNDILEWKNNNLLTKR